MKNEMINKTKERFDQDLHTDEYKIIHSDQTHLDNLLNMLEVEVDEKYLDLGTGNGYIAFEMANRYNEIFVEGLDIAES